MGKNSETLKDGVCVITLSSWQEFNEKVRHIKSSRGYVWRGQKKDEGSKWFLRSSFDRKVKTTNKHDRNEKLRLHLDNFRAEMQKSYPFILPLDDNDIWALGQHYGLLTPLIDWTLSPYVAAYFAFKDGIAANDLGDNYRYIYALNRSIERLINKKANLILSPDRYVPFIDKLSHENPRFLAQKGIFTKAFQGNTIEQYVQGFSRRRHREVLIVKLKIPTQDRNTCLKDLHSMGIDHTSLLLDIHDVADRCNKKLQ
jgi:hypothetical protein